MIPERLQPYFKTTRLTENNGNRIIEGVLTCCNAYDFEIYVVGRLKHGLLSKMSLYPESGNTVLEVRCKKCGKIISVFNSTLDGYGQCGKEHHIKCALPASVNCVKCRNNSFAVTVKYEYPDIQELNELEISDADNAFTWIWITLVCSKCGTRYRNFINCETT